MTERNGRLRGRRIVVTGAAAGIGQAVARLFAEEGARLALLDKDGERLIETATALEAYPVPADVTDADAVGRAIAGAEAAMGGLDGIVNSAGILRTAPIIDLTLEAWRTVLDINLTGTMLACRAAAPALLRAGGGTIVNLASLAAVKPGARLAAYAASKAGVVALTKCLALELGPTVRANVVCPGLIATPMTAALMADEALVATQTGQSALARAGRAEEVARAILYLSTGDSSYVSGETLVVDGGTLCR